MKAYYNDHGEIEKMDATGNARLISHSKDADTTMTGTHLNLFFTATANDSVLSSAQARGNAFLESKPLPDVAGQTPDTKVIHSDAVDVFMKPDGKDLDHVSTLAPGHHGVSSESDHAIAAAGEIGPHAGQLRREK